MMPICVSSVHHICTRVTLSEFISFVLRQKCAVKGRLETVHVSIPSLHGMLVQRIPSIKHEVTRS